MIKKQNKIITKIYNRFNIIIRETKTKTKKQIKYIAQISLL